MIAAAERWTDCAVSIEKIFAMTRLKAIENAKTAMKARQAEIVAFLQASEPKMLYITVEGLQDLPDADMYKLLILFNQWKEKKKSEDQAGKFAVGLAL